MTQADKKEFDELKTSVTELVLETRESNKKINKIHERVFEENGRSLIGEVRNNRESISRLDDNIKNIGKSGKKIKGVDTGDIWKYGFRIIVIVMSAVLSYLGIGDVFK